MFVFSLELTITSALFCLHPPLTSITMKVEFYENIHVFFNVHSESYLYEKKNNYNILALFIYLASFIVCIFN